MYEIKHRVRYSEISPNQHVPIGQIVKYFQDCSTFNSEDIGLGLEYLEKTGYAWLLAAWQIEIIRYPAIGEEIVIATWPYDKKGILAYRNFEIRDLEGNRIAMANSIWFYMNLKTGVPKRIEDKDVDAYGQEEKLPMQYKARKIKLPALQWEDQEDFPVKKADLDTNGHVNNARYIEMAMEYMDIQNFIISMRADYRKSAVFGDRIYPRVCRNEAFTYVELCDRDYEPYVIIEFECREEKE